MANRLHFAEVLVRLSVILTILSNALMPITGASALAGGSKPTNISAPVLGPAPRTASPADGLNQAPVDTPVPPYGTATAFTEPAAAADEASATPTFVDVPGDTPTSVSPDSAKDASSETATTVPEASTTPTAEAPASSLNLSASPEQVAGLGASTPQNGASILLFDHPYPDLFTGRASFSLPIWTPRGRNGMAPSLALTYSSTLANGILGDVQAPWTGMGWNIDTIQIARQITDGNCDPCGNGSYGYANNFLLLANGTGYELIPDGTTPGRFHTKAESFFYIQLHNDALGNNTPAAQNATGEWWEVVQRDGTRWRLGWNAESEQLAAMAGYPGAATGSWAALGYAGHATDVVAFRWRADLATDTHGNTVELSYFEESRQVAGSTASYDRASYLDTIYYTGGSLSAGYSVHFVRQSRTAEIPSAPTDWDNWDTYLLGQINVAHGPTIERVYALDYQVRSYSDNAQSWETTVLTSLQISGGGISLPAMTFDYADEDNRAACGTGCPVWAYPRLSQVANGWGATSSYMYSNDGRGSDSWYNWNLSGISVADGVNPSPMSTAFSYSTPCYNDPAAGWCNAGNVGELIGYGQVTSTAKDFDGSTALAITVDHYFTDEQRAGRDNQLERKNAAGAVLSRTDTAYTVVTSGLPSGGYFTYPSQVQQYLGSTMISQTAYTYDAATGSLTLEEDYDGTPTLYRQKLYEYVTNASPSVWILNTLSRQRLQDASGTTVSEMQFGYDGDLPGAGTPTLGELTLKRVVGDGQTVDTGYVYDAYGNLTETHAYKNYGTVGTAPTGAYRLTTVTYDNNLKTYPTSVTNPLNQTSGADYDYGLGVVTTSTDANNNATSMSYDDLGRVTSITFPGYHQPNIQYTYPTGTAPVALQADMWDESASVYRSSWQITDGLGRSIQTQSPYQTSGSLILKDTSYDALGRVLDQGSPRTLAASGGIYSAPSWGSVPHIVMAYDAIGRAVSVGYPDSSQETFSYSGLRTARVDRNNHQKVQEQDAFGRVIKAEDYRGTGSFTLYATTNYQYDVRDLLSTVTDAQSHQTTIAYDGFGRKISMTDPDMGTWTYANYDVFGNLGLQTDARTCTTTVTYDDLNRPLQKTYAGPGACATTPSVTYTYDETTADNQGIGRRTGMTDGSGSSTWFYNRLGQATSQTKTIDGTAYPFDFTFDGFGRPLTESLPSSESLSYSYNAMGGLSGLSGTSTYVSQINYNASGQVTDEQLGNGLLQQYCYDANTQRLTGIRVYSGTLQDCGTQPSNPVLNLSYSYQPNGNLSQTVDATQNLTINYTYDELDRLLSASGPNSKNYAYDTGGNVTSVTSTPTLTSVVAGWYHNCALTSAGGVKCWGRNNYGQLGDGTTTDHNTPVDVVGLTSGVVAITAAGYHTCALTAAGGIKCWGDNTYGDLGDGTQIMRTTPVDVVGLTSGVSAVSAGGAFTCAITTGGGAKCWGWNNHGQLGDDSYNDRSTPVDVKWLTSGVASIAAGGRHTCAVTTAGAAKCWGANEYGQLGDRSTKDSKVPTDVYWMGSGVVAIATGDSHSCALQSGTWVRCWGNNASGQLGHGDTTSYDLPVIVSGLTSDTVTKISGGFAHTCVVTTSGGAKCWGRNDNGQLGDGTTNRRLYPVDVTGFTSGATVITAGYIHSCALVGAGIKCWGNNSYGQLGDGTTVTSYVPVNTNFGSAGNYSYNNHQVTSLSTGETYTYDEDGNMITRVEGGLTYTQTFDATNHMVSVTVSGQTTQFVYDGDGTLVERIKPDGSKTIYAGGTYEVSKSASGVVTGTITYYPAGGAISLNGTPYYLLKDRLTSTFVTTDATGSIVGQMRYYATGETLSSTGSLLTDHLFTGQRQMSDLGGIYQLGARFYSPTLGRFLSADPFVQQPLDPQSWNRYSYVLNNPLAFIDPSGYFCTAGHEDWGPSDWAACHPSSTPPTSGDGGGGGDGGSGGSGGGGSGTSASGCTFGGDYLVACSFATSTLANALPGTSQQWSSVGTFLDEAALVYDTLLGIYVLAWVGVGLVGGLSFEGNPVTGLAGAAAGYIIGEGSIYTSGALVPSNIAATIATGTTIISDMKSGSTDISGQLIVSSSGINLNATGQVASTSVISTVLSTIGWAANIDTLSLPIQIGSVANDLGMFGSSTIPVNVSYP